MTKTNSADVQLGSPVWIFDGNVRHYTDGGRLVYSKSFLPYIVSGETRDSWLLQPASNARLMQQDQGFSYKVNKKTLALREKNLYGKKRRIYTSKAEVDDAVFVHERRGVIGNAVLRCDDATTLRRISELLD